MERDALMEIFDSSDLILTMDNDRLISLVNEREPLWDVKCKKYHNRDIARKLWQEIAKELKTTAVSVKSRWQNLRDNFRREHLKCRGVTKGYAQSTTWKYYDQLLFLAEAVTSKKDKLNKSSSSGQNSQQGDCKSEDEDTTASMGDLEVSNGSACNGTDRNERASNESARNGSAEGTDMESASTEGDNRKSAGSKLFKNQSTQMKRKLDTGNEADTINQFIQLEIRKMEQYERIQKLRKISEDLENDEDYHFLMSLLPHLRDIPKNKKLSTRMRLQQVLVDRASMEDVPTSLSNNH